MLFHYIATPTSFRQRAADLFAAVASGTIRAEVRQRYPLDAVADAHRDLRMPGRRPVPPYSSPDEGLIP